MSYNYDSRTGTATVSTGPSVQFFGLLFITFLVLKLTHVIDWSWWWITAPLWGPSLLVAIVVLVPLVLIVRADRKRKRLWRRLRKRLAEPPEYMTADNYEAFLRKKMEEEAGRE